MGMGRFKNTSHRDAVSPVTSPAPAKIKEIKTKLLTCLGSTAAGDVTIGAVQLLTLNITGVRVKREEERRRWREA